MVRMVGGLVLAGCALAMGCAVGEIDGSFAASDVLEVDVSALTFPEQTVGEPSAPRPVVIKNKRNGRSITLTQVTTQAPFSTDPLATPIKIAAQASTTIYVTFTPTSAGSFAGALVCVFASGGVRTYPLSGVAVDPAPNDSDVTPPSVSLIAPATSLTVTAAQSVTLSAAASDNVAVARVEFYDGATLLGVDTTSPYEYALALSASANGVHTVTARAVDAAGNAATSGARVITVNIPTGPATYSATLAWDANVESDLDGYLVYVRAGSAAYGAPLATVNATTYQVSGLAPGTYSFRVSAVDTGGLESAPSAEVSRTFP